MARFVEFINRTERPVWINPDCVVGVAEHEKGIVGIFGADGENPWIVPGTVAEVLAKLQGDPQPEPAKTRDDIAGWWVDEKGQARHVIGYRSDGQVAYEYSGGLWTAWDAIDVMNRWTRDPNRKGWE